MPPVGTAEATRIEITPHQQPADQRIGTSANGRNSARPVQTSRAQSGPCCSQQIADLTTSCDGVEHTL